MPNFDIFGVFVLIIVIIALIVFRRRNIHGGPAEVLAHGKIVLATVTEIEERSEISGGNLKFAQSIVRYYIRAEWIDLKDQHKYFFISNPLLGIPEHIHVGGTIKVRIDPEDPYEYMVDIAS